MDPPETRRICTVLDGPRRAPFRWNCVAETMLWVGSVEVVVYEAVGGGLRRCRDLGSRTIRGRMGSCCTQMMSP